MDVPRDDAADDPDTISRSDPMSTNDDLTHRISPAAPCDPQDSACCDDDCCGGTTDDNGTCC
jgi:hypothetical protein